MFRISDAVRMTGTEDGEILLDLRHGQVFGLNVMASKIIELLQRGCDEAQITDEISRAYQTSVEIVRADVHEFIEVLHKHHVLEPDRSCR